MCMQKNMAELIGKMNELCVFRSWQMQQLNVNLFFCWFLNNALDYVARTQW